MTKITKDRETALIREFKRITNESEDIAVSYLESEEWDLDDALMDYRAFHGIRTSR